MHNDSEPTSRPTISSSADEPATRPAADEPPKADAAEARDRYELEIDPDSDSTHARVVRLVGSDRRVLELGPATGHMTRVLKERGCSVVGIEIDPAMADLAGRFCERVIVGDLDELDLDAELGSDRFDVIVAADVLEHLKDPLSALRRLRGFLNDHGHFVISLPNVAHGSVRIALLQGHFSYRRVGLLDATHLRFFTRESISELLDQAELAVAEIFHQQLNIDASEVPFDRERVPDDVLEQLAQDPDARTYQFVIKAVALDTPGLRELQRRLRELAQENAQLREATLDTQELHELKEELRELKALASRAAEREAQLRGALIAAHDRTLRRDEEIQRLQGALKVAESEAAELRGEATRLRVRLERITNSPPVRAYSKLATLPGFKTVRAARTEGYHRALRRAGDGGSSGS